MSSENGQTFGQWIKEKLWEKRLKANVAAEQAGMKLQQWSRIQNDKTYSKSGRLPQIERETVRKIAQGLDVPYSEALVAAGYSAEEDLPTGELSLRGQEEVTEEIASLKRLAQQLAQRLQVLETSLRKD